MPIWLWVHFWIQPNFRKVLKVMDISKIRSTCDSMDEHRWSATAMRNTVHFDIIARVIHQVRDCNVTGFTGQPELQRVRLLLRVTNLDNKAIKVARQCVPVQAEVMGASRRSNYRPQLRDVLWTREECVLSYFVRSTYTVQYSAVLRGYL